MSGPVDDEVDRINIQLRREFGVDMTSDRPNYRVVWSNDQYEKRLMHYTDKGVELLSPEVREVPKYKQWAADRYILERLSFIGEMDAAKEMTVHKISYEPIWSFVDNKMNYLPPRYEVAKIIIDALHAKIHGDNSLAKYKDKTNDPEETARRVEAIQHELFGEETATGDALAHGEAIVVPRNYEKGVH